jgi:hypothetical protein
MKISILFLLAGLISLTSCKESCEVAPNKNVAALQDQFHGKYKPLHSTSSQALDVNRDGKASTDMLEEISDLPQTWIEVRIYDKSQYYPKPSFSFIHQWPKQELRPENPTSTNPLTHFIYATKVVYWNFSLDNLLTQLLIEPNASYLTDPDLFSPLEKVLVKDNDRLEVTLTKRLYTTEGWKTVQIVTLYERFTRET